LYPSARSSEYGHSIGIVHGDVIPFSSGHY
jgi:hypothetical protein